MSNKHRTPDIRFKDFEDNWKTYRLSEVATIQGGGTPSTKINEYWDGDIDWYSPIEIGDQIYVDSSQKKITELGLQNSSAQLLPVGTVLYTSRAGIGNTAILSKVGATNQGFQSIIPKGGKLDSYYIYSNSMELKKYGEKYGAGSTFIEISGKEFSKMPLILPTLKEQKKIGEFIKFIDEILSLKNRQVQQTKELKRGMLLRLIPKRVQKNPEIRFEGFKNNWKLNKLSSYLSIPKKELVDIKSTSDLMTVKLNLGGVYEGSNRDTLSLGSTNYYRRKAGQLIYGKQNFFNGSMAIIPEDLDGHATSTDVPSLDIEGIDVNFLFVFISRRDYWREKESQSIGTGSKRIHEKTLLTFDIKVPELLEQQKIGSFFQKLDKYIELQEREIELLEETKKGFLQKMFV